MILGSSGEQIRENLDEFWDAILDEVYNDRREIDDRPTLTLDLPDEDELDLVIEEDDEPARVIIIDL